jgi:hypothetical protein
MKLLTILIALLIPFLFFAQHEDSYSMSIEAGIKYTYASKSSKEGTKSSPGHNFHTYQLDQSKTQGTHGFVQVSFMNDQFIFPIGIGFLRWQEELNGSYRGGSNLLMNPSYYGADVAYKSYTDYGNVFVGAGVNFLQHSDKQFFGLMFRVNYLYMFGNGRVITQDENATNYLNLSAQLKHQVRPSAGIIYRLNTQTPFTASFEAGFDLTARNSTTMGSINSIVGGIYTQFSIGVDLEKLLSK